MEKARKKYRYIFQDMSIRKKIFFGYLAIIGIVLLCVIALFAVLWEKLNKDSISKSIYSSNYQIVKSIDNYFDSVIKLSEFPYLDSEIMDILRKDYQGISEERKMIEQIQDVNAINRKSISVYIICTIKSMAYFCIRKIWIILHIAVIIQ